MVIDGDNVITIQRHDTFIFSPARLVYLLMMVMAMPAGCQLPREGTPFLLREGWWLLPLVVAYSPRQVEALHVA